MVLVCAGLSVLAVALIATPLGAGASSTRRTAQAASSKPGPRGPRGPRGFPGKRGRKGPRGPTGLVGAIGPRGARGFAGATGPMGVQGPTGGQGATGPTGPAGASASDHAGFSLSTVDGPGVAAADASITIGADGLPLISYYDPEFQSLRAPIARTSRCTRATKTTIDTAGDVGRDSSITHRRGRPRPDRLLDFSNLQLRVAHCENAACWHGDDGVARRRRLRRIARRSGATGSA